MYKGTRLINPELYPGATPGGVFCDPQLGCSKGMVSADLSTSRSQQWTQEVRVQSNFDGPSNFLLGANYLNFKPQDNYYVFNNLFTLIGKWFYATDPLPQGMSPKSCDLGDEEYECIYVDPNPIDKVNNKGRNYFLSQNGVEIDSWGLFGEYYLDLSNDVELILGARYTKDKKLADQVPSQLLLGGGQDTPFPGNVTGGSVNSGYPGLDNISQSWGRFTGRAVVNWKPELEFSEDSLIYASLSRGYKGGGVNPPRVDFNPDVVQYQFLPQTFKPEYVNSIEIGTKLAFNGGRFTLNATAFYYDYKDYQVSQIVDRIAYNENFDATSMGLEFEGVWRPTSAVRFDANFGYLRTRIAAGSQSIDVMNRTQGNEDWLVLRPWLQVPSNCIAPKAIVELILANPVAIENALASLCPGSNRAGRWDPAVPGAGSLFYETYGVMYNPLAPYNPNGMEIVDGRFVSGAPNGGRGFSADLEGNELPNAPRFTLNVGAQYTIDLDRGRWELTLRGDYYHQSKSFGRVYNTEFDRLKAWGNVNLSATLGQVSKDFSLQLYVKNLLNKSPITGFFVNSDDTGLTTNVFVPDPRVIGFSAKFGF